MDFIAELRHRDLLQDFTPELEEHLSQHKPVVGYIGFDPTAPSLTIGNYVPIMLLKLFQLSGHQPIMLFGGATGRIGDPSGKDKERELKPAAEIEANLAAQKAQARQLLAPAPGLKDVLFVDNFEFYEELSAIDFLRNVGKTLTINYMMSKDSVKSRLETGMSFTEFSYQLLQGYDFECLHKKYNCTLQMGGSDQWGNITAGTEFVRRNLGGKAYGLTVPLLTKADGRKFGKSEAGNIWLDPERTSPYEFYQFWINSDDRDLSRYIRTFSLRDREALDSLLTTADTDPRLAKEQLASELTTRIHGEEAYENAEAVSQLLFNRKASADQLRALKPGALALIAREVPSASLDRNLLAEGILQVIDVLSEHTNLVDSKTEAKRAIASNAVSINKVKVSNLEAVLTEEDLLYNRYIMIENGKKNKLIVEVA